MHNQCPARSRWTRNIFKNKLMNEQTACPGFSPRSLNSHHPDFTHDDFRQTAFVTRRPAACASHASKSRSPTANFLRMCYLRHFYPTLYLALGLKLLASRKKKKKSFHVQIWAPGSSWEVRRWHTPPGASERRSRLLARQVHGKLTRQPRGQGGRCVCPSGGSLNK